MKNDINDLIHSSLCFDAGLEAGFTEDEIEECEGDFGCKKCPLLFVKSSSGLNIDIKYHKNYKNGTCWPTIEGAQDLTDRLINTTAPLSTTERLIVASIVSAYVSMRDGNRPPKGAL